MSKPSSVRTLTVRPLEPATPAERERAFTAAVEEAERHLRMALSIRENAAYMTDLGNLFNECARHADAGDVYRAALELVPDDAVMRAAEGYPNRRREARFDIVEAARRQTVGVLRGLMSASWLAGA